MKTLGTPRTSSSSLRHLGIVMVTALCTIVLAVLGFALLAPRHSADHSPYGSVAPGQSDWTRELVTQLNQKPGYDDQLQILATATCNAVARAGGEDDSPDLSDLKDYVAQAELYWGNRPLARDYRDAVHARCGYNTGNLVAEDD